MGKSTSFQLNGFTIAKKVFLSGNFNGWNPDELSMERTPQGWKLDYILAPGNYEYKFVIMETGSFIRLTGYGNPINMEQTILSCGSKSDFNTTFSPSKYYIIIFSTPNIQLYYP